MPPLFRRRSIRFRSAGAFSNSPLAIAALMRGRSCITRRPAPMLRCPTSELPICPGGSPTSLPDVRRSACGQAAHRRSKLGRAGLPDGVVGRLLAPAPAVQYDQHHRTTLLHLHVPHASPAAVKSQPPAATGASSEDVCVGLRLHRQPAVQLAVNGNRPPREPCFAQDYPAARRPASHPSMARLRVSPQ